MGTNLPLLVPKTVITIATAKAFDDFRSDFFNSLVLAFAKTHPEAAAV